jgi:hypothetical protein
MTRKQEAAQNDIILYYTVPRTVLQRRGCWYINAAVRTVLYSTRTVLYSTDIIFFLQVRSRGGLGK